MAKYRHIYKDFWEDPKVQEEFTAEDRYFYLYLLTNPHTTQIGIYKITAKQIAFDIGHSIESAKVLIKRFEQDYNIIRYNPETRELAILNWGKYNLNKGGKPILDCVKRELSEVKDISMILKLADKIPNNDIKLLFKQYDESIHDTSDDTCNDSIDDTSTRSGQKEKEKENQKEKENKKEIVAQDHATTQIDLTKINAYEYYQVAKFGMLNAVISQDIKYYIDEFGDEGDGIVKTALEIAVYRGAEKMNWKYVKGILNTWLNTNHRTVEDIKAYEKQELEKRKRNSVSFNKSKTSYEKTPDWVGKEANSNSELTLEEQEQARKELFG